MSLPTAQKKPATGDWHRADVIAALRKKGWSLQQLALENGYNQRSSLSKALGSPSPKGEAIIAAALGVQPQIIWPSRYNSDGTPNRTRGPKPMRPDLRVVKATTSAAQDNLRNGRG
ncbi:MAG: helix-turn-helix transcriptional regulator [Luteibacter sp.]